MKAKYISPVCDIMETDIICSFLAGSDHPNVETVQIVSEPEDGGFNYGITTGTGGGWSSLAKGNRFYHNEEDW